MSVSPIQNAGSSFKLTRIDHHGSPPVTGTPVVATGLPNDQVRINFDMPPEAIFNGRTKGIFGDAIDGNQIRLDKFAQILEEKSAALSAELDRRLREAGIDTSKSFDYKFDPSGEIKVTNDHPDRQKIEEFFAANTNLRDGMRTLESHRHLLETGNLVRKASASGQDHARTRALIVELDTLIGGSFSDGKLKLRVAGFADRAGLSST